MPSCGLTNSRDRIIASTCRLAKTGDPAAVPGRLDLQRGSLGVELVRHHLLSAQEVPLVQRLGRPQLALRQGELRLSEPDIRVVLGLGAAEIELGAEVGVEEPAQDLSGLDPVAGLDQDFRNHPRLRRTEQGGLLELQRTAAEHDRTARRGRGFQQLGPPPAGQARKRAQVRVVHDIARSLPGGSKRAAIRWVKHRCRSVSVSVAAAVGARDHAPGR